MSVTSLRSVRSITPIENPDDLAFFDAVIQDKPNSGSKVRADNLFGGHELDKHPDDIGEFEKREVRELDEEEKVEGLENFNSKNVVQVKSNNEDDHEDIYDFDYVKVNQNSEKSQSPESQKNGEAGRQSSHGTTEYFPEENNDTHGKYQTDFGESVKVGEAGLSLENESQYKDVDKKHHGDETLERYQEDDVNLESVEKTEFKSVSKVKSISIHTGPGLEDILSDQHTLSLESPIQKGENQDLNIDYEQISEKREDGQRNIEKEAKKASTSHKEDNRRTNEQDAGQTSETFYEENLIGDLNTGNNGKLNVARDESENNAIEFDDSVENSYFAMFKKSENNAREDKDNRQYTEGNTETAEAEVQAEETKQTVHHNQTLSKENVNGNSNDQFKVDSAFTDVDVDIVFKDKNSDDVEGLKTREDTQSEKKIELNESVEEEQDTRHDQQDDAGQPNHHHSIETTKKYEETMPIVTEERKFVPVNENSERTNNIEDEQDEYYENDSNDVDEPGRKASAKTLRSTTSTHTKSAHAHRVTESHKAIEEMNALERLKHTPYTEHMAKGYNKHVSSSSASHSRQQNPKQKKQRQHKSGADHRGGGESNQGHQRGKTDEGGAPHKKEPMPRMGSGTASGQEKQNQAPKGKKSFFRRKERKPSATVARPSKTLSDENMNEVKDVKETPKGADEISAANDPEDLPPEKQEVAQQPSKPTADTTSQVVLVETFPPISDVPDKTDGPSATDPVEIEKPPEGPGPESTEGQTALEEKTLVAASTEITADKEVKNEDENKSATGKNNAEANGKGTPKSKKQKETVKSKTNGDDQKGSGPRNWFGGKKKQNQGDNSSVKNKTRPKSSLPLNGIIITTSSEDSPKGEESKLITDAKPVPEVPAALTIVDETNGEPQGKAGRVVLANIKQKLLKDSSFSGSHGSVPTLPLSQRSRSPSPETSFSSSNGSKLAKAAHKTHSMSSLQVPGAALTTPRDHGQDDDTVSLTSRRDSTSRRSVDYRIQDAAAAMAPDAADEKPKSVLTNDETFIKNAIPYLPLSLAIVCLLLNIVVPGSGTALSGLSILCCGQARVSNKNDQILTTLCANCLVGLAQLFTVTFLLVGWFWSIGWGIQMVSLSVQHREEVKKQRAKELQALALSAFGSPKRGAPFGP